MKYLLGEVLLKNRHTGLYEPARVFREIDESNFVDFEANWLPVLKSRRADFTSAQEAAQGNAQDSHWDWIGKALNANQDLAWETFALECDGHTQGLMLVDVTRFARLEPHRGREIAYVELLATAPWNRHLTVENPKYQGVGQILMATAVSLSVELGFEGRVGLHSLPQSESWYRDRAGFTDVEFDHLKKMRYFEMTATQAAAFIGTQEAP